MSARRLVSFLFLITGTLLVAPVAVRASCENIYLYERGDGTTDYIAGHLYRDCREARASVPEMEPSWCEGKDNCRFVESVPDRSMSGERLYGYIAIDPVSGIYAVGRARFEDDARDRAEAACERKGGHSCFTDKLF